MKFVYMTSHFSVAVVNKILKIVIHLLKPMLFIVFTYILHVLNMRSKHLASQVTKFFSLSYSIIQTVWTLVWKRD
jgi:hypothetical protein